MLQVEGLSVDLPHGRAVDDLSFTLEKGSTLALVGESGCGKSLTALSMLGLTPFKASGKVLLDGKNLLTLSERRLRKVRGSRIAMIFQDPTNCLNPVYSVGDQLVEAMVAHNKKGNIVAALEEVGLQESCLGSYPHQLSGGQRQRVMIAMALLLQPDVLIADEPTTALDVTIQAQVLDLLKALDAAILLITHDMGVVAEMAQRVAVMYAGQIVEEAPIEEIFDHPKHPYTQGLFAARNLIPIEGSVPPIGQLPQGCRFHPRCPKVFDPCKSCEPKNQRLRCHLYAES